MFPRAAALGWYGVAPLALNIQSFLNGTLFSALPLIESYYLLNRRHPNRKNAVRGQGCCDTLSLVADGTFTAGAL